VGVRQSEEDSFLVVVWIQCFSLSSRRETTGQSIAGR
jgi:hypothetical protein